MPTCGKCFIQHHRTLPFHWAEVWDFEQGFFIRNDISNLGHVLQLGHNGANCPNPQTTLPFTVVDTNGIHATHLAFCGCLKCGSKIEQLMRARLFPATARDPRTAFTFATLNNFHIHTLESKKAAYDYLGALRRLTDNSFTADVPVCYHSTLVEVSYL